MKTGYKYMIAASMILVVNSCAEKITSPTDQSSDDLVLMEFHTDTDAKVIARTSFESQKVLWDTNDKITVFSVDGGVSSGGQFDIMTVSDDRTSATFKGYGNPDASTFYAVYPHLDSNGYDAASSTITVTIPTVQTAVGGGFASGANVSVACSDKESEGKLQFRNITTLLCIMFDDADDAQATKSITFKVKNKTGYWGISGQADVYMDVLTGNPTLEEGSVDYVTLLSPEGGFLKDVLYYIPVYPVGECTGFEIVFTDLNDDPFTKTNNNPGSLDRNWVFNFGAIPEIYHEKGFDFAALSVSWSHLQWISSTEIESGGVLDAGVKVFVDGLTNSELEEGYGKEQFEVELGYGLEADPSNESWIWKSVEYNGDWGSEYYFQGKSDPIHVAGTYYYSFRIRYAGKDYVYAGNNGLWNAESNPCLTFTVNEDNEFAGYSVSWANIQWSVGNYLNSGDQYEAGTKIFVPGLTDTNDSYATEQFEVEIGYGTESVPTGISWVWTPVAFNGDWGNEYYFQGKTSSISVPGSYYCAFRIRFAGKDYVYADKDGLWDGISDLRHTFMVSE